MLPKIKLISIRQHQGSWTREILCLKQGSTNWWTKTDNYPSIIPVQAANPEQTTAASSTHIMPIQVGEPEQTTADSSTSIIPIQAGEPEQRTARSPNSVIPEINNDFNVSQMSRSFLMSHSWKRVFNYIQLDRTT